MSRAALLPSIDQVGGGGIIRAGLDGIGECSGRDVVGEEAEAARCCSTSRIVEPGGGWDVEIVVVLVGASSEVKILTLAVASVVG
jgi:hypothetical protein